LLLLIDLSFLLGGAGLLVGESEDRFKPRQAPPAVLSREVPEPLGNAGVESMRRYPALPLLGTDHDAANFDRTCFIISIVNYDRRERPRMAVMSGDDVQEQVAIDI
jgi:hypothetical protein